MQFGHNQIQVEVTNCKVVLKIMNTVASATSDALSIKTTITVSHEGLSSALVT